MNYYRCFFNAKHVDLEAETTYKAKQLAEIELKVSKKHAYRIYVMPLKINGKDYINPTDF